MNKYFKSFGLFTVMGIIPLILLYLLVTTGGIRPLLTDSVSFDLKADKVGEANLGELDVMGLGSSIALNNIGSKAIQEYIGEEYSYYNFSSWGLTMRDLNIMLPVLLDKYKPKVLLIASGPMDFEKPKVGMCTTEEYQWYIENRNMPYFYAKNTDIYGLIQRKRTANKYTKNAVPEQRIHLLFDEWGGCNLETKRENFQWFRYNDNLYKDTVNMQYDELRQLCELAKSKNTKLIFAVSPMKKVPNCVDKPCQEFIQGHVDKTRQIVESSGSLFLDMHTTHTYSDSLFCDESHLVYGGPDKFSEDIIAKIPFKDFLTPASKPVVQQ